MRCCSAGAGRSSPSFRPGSGMVGDGGLAARMNKASHVEGGRWYARKESDMARTEKATSMVLDKRGEEGGRHGCLIVRHRYLGQRKMVQSQCP